MRRNIEHEELQKHTLHLYRGDYSKLQEMFPNQGAAVVIRKLVRMKLNEINARAKQDVEIKV